VRNLTPDLQEISQEELVDKLVASGMRAQLQMQSLLTGKLYISLEYFPDSQARFLGLSEDYVEIPSVVTKTEMLEEQVENILTTLSHMDLDTLTIMATRLISTADSTLKTADVERTLATMRQTLKSTEIAFNRISKQIDPLAEGVIRTNEDIQSAIITLNELLRRLDQISLENRYQFSQTIQELRRATRTIRDLADQIERNPESIFFGKD
jgi:paraquat-inducible protein B